MQKKIGRIVILLLAVLSLAACRSSDNETKNNEAKAEFTGTISEIKDQSALVIIETGEILHSGDRVSVDLSNSEGDFQAGDKVKVGYDGIVRESYPLGINVIYVEKIE